MSGAPLGQQPSHTRPVGQRSKRIFDAVWKRGFKLLGAPQNLPAKADLLGPLAMLDHLVLEVGNITAGPK